MKSREFLTPKTQVRQKCEDRPLLSNSRSGRAPDPAPEQAGACQGGGRIGPQPCAAEPLPGADTPAFFVNQVPTNLKT